ncbi:MAG: prolyl oligopeptidase family serine peptidase [Actinomycetes bacterium]
MNTGFLTRSIHDDDVQRLYQVYVPSNYDPAQHWPVILFLHGAGEGGRDGLLPTEYQLGSAIRRNASRYPGLVVFPQVRTYQPVWTSVDVDFAMRVLGRVQQDFAVDAARVYLTGVSTGAKAAWHALYRHADVFAAALIVAGVVRPLRADGTRVPDPDPVVPDADGDPSGQLARVLRATPIWTFHGDDDPVFPVSDAREVMAALAAQGAPVRYTELPGFGHDVWDVAYYSNDVADWLFAQARQR